MKSISVELMEKSFIASISLSFLLAFATVAYLASPFSIEIQAATAEANTIEAAEPKGISFDELNIITLTEYTPTLASSSTALESLVTAQSVTRTEVEQTKKITKQTAHPVRLIIPSIGLDAPIDPMGVNSKGEMDVPDGQTPNVGWYKHGTIPGNTGSAVIDAHVFAAFSDLKDVAVGSSVFVVNADGEKLEFKVGNTNVYRLGDLSSGKLFSRKDARRLNLITCAGERTADGSTYTHRLVVYTTLIG